MTMNSGPRNGWGVESMVNSEAGGTGLATRPHASSGSAKAALHPLGPARDRRQPRAHHFDQPERNHQRDEAVDLARLARHLEHEALGRGVDDLRAERVR